MVVIIEEPSWTSLTVNSADRDSVIGNPGRCRIRCRDCGGYSYWWVDRSDHDHGEAIMAMLI